MFSEYISEYVLPMGAIVSQKLYWLIGSFCPKILDRWWGPTKAFCCSTNADVVGIVLSGVGDTVDQH